MSGCGSTAAAIYFSTTIEKWRSLCGVLNGTTRTTRLLNPSRNQNPFFPPPLYSQAKDSPWKRRWLSPLAAASTTSLELPLLPFNTNEVLVPSESKTLHLVEARYLALLEESLSRTKKLFVHFVLDPILISSSGNEASFAARCGCLVLIEDVERLDVGALVSIRGISRVRIVNFLQSDPYLKGEVRPMQDSVIDSESEVSSKVMAVKDALHSLNSLEIKLKAPKEALLQTRIANSLAWAEKEPVLECDGAFIPSLAKRISFAAFQLISGCTQSEVDKLQQQKLRAMDVKSTEQRLGDSLDLVKENISVVAAKLAVQSLEMQLLSWIHEMVPYLGVTPLHVTCLKVDNPRYGSSLIQYVSGLRLSDFATLEIDANIRLWFLPRMGFYCADPSS